MTTAIKNCSKRRVLIHLAHPVFFKKRWGFRRVVVVTYHHEPKTGKKGLLEHNQRCPGVLTLQPGEERKGLPDEVAKLADVKKLGTALRLTVEVSKKEPTAVTKKAEPPRAKAAAKKASR